MVDKKIKVIYIIPTLNMGGAEKIVSDLAINIDKEIFEVKLICISSGGYFENQLKENSIEVILLKKKPGFNIKTFFILYKLLKKEKPDIVHTHLFGADFYGRIIAKILGIKTVTTEHNSEFSDGVIKKIFNKWMSKLADHTIAVSTAVQNYVILKMGISAEKVEVIYNGINLKKFLNKKRKYFKKDDIIIGSIGRLTKQKGFDYLIEAMSKIDNKNVQCKITGDGKDRNKLEKQIKKLGLEKQVKLVGIKKDIPDFLDSLDIFVLPSRWEGLGIVILEAGASGLPVLASKVDGIKEIINNGENGLFFEVGNTDDLAEKLKELIKSNDKRKKIGKALQKTIIQNFDIKKITKQYEKVYLKILNK